MTDMNNMPDDTRAEDVQLIDRLVGRMVDGEAGGDDHARFREMAEDDPQLWRRLAEAQETQRALVSGFEATIASALEADLPEARRARRGLRPGWLVATGIGWAAAVALGLGWISSMSSAPPRDPGVKHVDAELQVPAPLRDPDQLMAEYLAAPNVIGELEPIVLELEEMSDGRTAVRYMRRIEEVVFIDAGEEIPVQGDPASDVGYLTEDPADLRGSGPSTTPLD
jgi:hypothetical protein